MIHLTDSINKAKSIAIYGKAGTGRTSTLAIILWILSKKHKNIYIYDSDDLLSYHIKKLNKSLYNKCNINSYYDNTDLMKHIDNIKDSLIIIDDIYFSRNEDSNIIKSILNNNNNLVYSSSNKSSNFLTQISDLVLTTLKSIEDEILVHILKNRNGNGFNNDEYYKLDDLKIYFKKMYRNKKINYLLSLK